MQYCTVAARVRVASRAARPRNPPFTDDARVDAEPAENIALALLHELDLLPESGGVGAFPQACDDALAWSASRSHRCLYFRREGDGGMDAPESRMSMARPALATAPVVKRRRRTAEA